MKTYFRIFKEAVIAALALVVAAIAINAVRSDGLPFIAEKAYDIYVPCPETLGYVELIDPNDSRILEDSTFLIDARSESEFNNWHLNGAFCLTYDYLDPIPEEHLQNIVYNIANSGKTRLVVYGDGDGEQGSTGYELGREIAGNGIKNVFIVKGGADALQKGLKQ